MFNLVPLRWNDVERDFLADFFTEDLLPKRWSSFKTDISEAEKEYTISADLPGFAKEDITIELNDGRLKISAKKNNETEEKKDNYIRRERYIGEVTRSFIFDNVKEDEVKAEFKDGVLKLSLPKKELPENKVRRIELN